MAHRRTQIRNAAVVLVEGVAGLTVTKSRLHNWQVSDLPGAAVYTLDEPVETVNIAKSQERTMRLVVDVHVKSQGNVDDDVDDQCVLVEKALAADPKFGGLAQMSYLRNTGIGLTGEGNERHGMARIDYDVLYRTAPNAPDA